MKIGAGTRPSTIRLAMFDKVLIANRGEIALRIIRGVSLTSGASPRSPSTASRTVAAARAHGGRSGRNRAGAATESYLVGDRIAAAADAAQAIHLGYGFERIAAFRGRRRGRSHVRRPHATPMAAMGGKVEARKAMHEAGVPIVPGTLDALSRRRRRVTVSDDRLSRDAQSRPAAGGAASAARRARRGRARHRSTARERGPSSFGNDTITRDTSSGRRHIEIQVSLVDRTGTRSMWASASARCSGGTRRSSRRRRARGCRPRRARRWRTPR